MKIIGHQGASMICRGNSIESLNKGAELGIYACECDIQELADNRYVIYHDDTLKNRTGENIAVKNITYEEMNEKLDKSGYKLYTWEDICNDYIYPTPLLLHVKFAVSESFAAALKSAPFNYICGVTSTNDVKTISEFLPPERILAFMHGKDKYAEFINAGAGIIRLWEQWLDDVTPEMVKSINPDVEVWIMANDLTPGIGMNGSIESLKKAKMLNADGILMNDILLAIDNI